MDIKEELKKFTANDNYGADIIKNIKIQQVELQQKLHLFNVISLINELEDQIANKFFEINSVYFIQLSLRAKYDDQYRYKLAFKVLDKDKTILHDRYSNGQTTQEILFLNKLFRSLNGIDSKLTNLEFKGKTLELELKPGIGEKIANFLLREELKKIYDYNQMDNELPDSKENNNKKLKV